MTRGIRRPKSRRVDRNSGGTHSSHSDGSNSRRSRSSRRAVRAQRARPRRPLGVGAGSCVRTTAVIAAIAFVVLAERVRADAV